MENIKAVLEALRNDLHHVPMTDRLGSAFRHLDAALSELDGSKPKELTDEEIEQWWGNTHRTMGHMPRTDFEMVAILRSFTGSLQPKEQGAEPAPSDLIYERSKPSLMVGFSEEDVSEIADRIANESVGELCADNTGEWIAAQNAVVDALLYANTRAVSIDRIMEVVMGWCCATKDAEEDLRERLMKIMP